MLSFYTPKCAACPIDRSKMTFDRSEIMIFDRSKYDTNSTGRKTYTILDRSKIIFDRSKLFDRSKASKIRPVENIRPVETLKNRPAEKYFRPVEQHLFRFSTGLWDKPIFNVRPVEIIRPVENLYN